MKASDYIKAMQALIDDHGDLEVEEFFTMGSRPAPKPEVCSTNGAHLNENEKGEKVIRV